ncbi:hypothetical protein RYX36_031767, partial [Vicia faba]
TSVLLSVGQSSNKSSTSANVDRVLFNGIVPVLIASVLSGIASSLCQWASHVKKHSSYLMTIEISIDGSTCLLASTLKSPDGEAIRRHGFFSWLDSSNLDPNNFEFPWWNSCWFSYKACWRCSKGICHCLSFTRYSIATIHF